MLGRGGKTDRTPLFSARLTGDQFGRQATPGESGLELRLGQFAEDARDAFRLVDDQRDRVVIARSRDQLRRFLVYQQFTV